MLQDFRGHSMPSAAAWPRTYGDRDVWPTRPQPLPVTLLGNGNAAGDSKACGEFRCPAALIHSITMVCQERAVACYPASRSEQTPAASQRFNPESEHLSLHIRHLRAWQCKHDGVRCFLIPSGSHAKRPLHAHGALLRRAWVQGYCGSRV